MIKHYIFYGSLGLLMEILWTGLGSMITGNFALTGHTYIWMFFIYGLGVLFEPVHDSIRNHSIFIRGFIWVFLIFVIELSTGFILRSIIGYCPWDYRGATNLTIGGYIRFDYAPAWFIVGLIFEKLHDMLDHTRITYVKY